MRNTENCQWFLVGKVVIISMSFSKVSPAAAAHDHGLLQELRYTLTVFGTFQWSIFVVITARVTQVMIYDIKDFCETGLFACLTA
jgi:hypothetical protein